jgi:glycosylphosphatidylinositol transamidase (GPIT) subunit GPI8
MYFETGFFKIWNLARQIKFEEMTSLKKLLLLLLPVLLLMGGTVSASASGGSHTNNWAVLVCTSRYWFNYRHMANTLSLYS